MRFSAPPHERPAAKCSVSEASLESRGQAGHMTVLLGPGCLGILYRLPQDGRSSAFFLLLPASEIEAWLPSASAGVRDVL